MSEMKDKLKGKSSGVILFALLIIYPFMCGIYDEHIRGLQQELSYGKAFFVSEIGVVCFSLFAIAGLFFIKHLIQSGWRLGILIGLIILLVYTVLIPAVVMMHVSFIGNQAMVLMREQYKIISAILLFYGIIYYFYWNKILGMNNTGNTKKKDKGKEKEKEKEK